ncbi:hypothetical protein GCM10018790_65600 [Kitasatospora xanthocidica]|uniref:hypothetical protein n=1 Tax=Kitasatospora xanthocidica TaxID=83382 RepID=UPI001678278B|nr:hypothetical protein [Kitasatospora xanthocidica]GHF78480.1 hypothetical protein GCM10018790_65600 [Kitasatospora xanthocidica]
MANMTRIWTTTRTNFRSADPAERWTARAAWAVLTATAWLAVMFTTVFGAEVAGVPMGTVTWLAIALSLAVPLVSWIAVTSEPGGRPGAPALTVVLLLAAVLLVIALT